MNGTKPRSLDSYVLGLSLLLVVLLLLASGYFLWSRYNPFFDQADEFKEATAIGSAARKRPLTASEFAECLQLCESGETVARMSAIASLEVAVGRSPEYKPEAIKTLKRVAAGDDPKASAAATAVLKRLSDPPAR